MKKSKTSAGVEHLPNEILLHIFNLGSWLPGSSDVSPEEIWEWKRHPPQLKPFAKLASSVCSKWGDIVKENQQLKVSKVILGLGSSFTGKDDIVEYLGQYTKDLKHSTDCDIDLLWYCSKTAALEADECTPEAAEIRLFMHGMALTGPFLPRVRRLEVVLMQPEALHLCFSLLNGLRESGSRLAWINVTRGFRFSKLGVQPTAGLLSSRCYYQEMETAACRFAATLPVLSDLYIGHVAVLPDFCGSLQLQHLHLTGCCSAEKYAGWNDIFSLLQHSPNLRNLHLGLPFVTGLPPQDKIVTCTLPNLDRLFLDGSSISLSLTLLSCLFLPRLQRLSLVRIHSDKQSEVGDRTLRELSSKGGGYRLVTAPPILDLEWMEMEILGQFLVNMDLSCVEELNVFLPEGFSREKHSRDLWNHEFRRVQLLYLYQLEFGSTTRFLDLISFPAIHHAKLIFGDPVVEGAKRLTKFWRTLTTSQEVFLSSLTYIEIDPPHYERSTQFHPFASLRMVEHFNMTGMDFQNVGSLEWLGKSTAINDDADCIVLPKLSILELTINPTMADSISEITEDLQVRSLVVQDVRKGLGYPLNQVVIRDVYLGLMWTESFI